MASYRTAFLPGARVPVHGSSVLARCIHGRADGQVRRRTYRVGMLTSAQEKGILGAGVTALPIVAWSEATLFTTGCGLPAGPGGVLGAAEGISYLVLLGLVGLSVYKKVTTGSGLPAGPKGLVGATEGVAYLLLALGLAEGVYIYFKFGSLPDSGMPQAVPPPGSRCDPYK